MRCCGAWRRCGKPMSVRAAKSRCRSRPDHDRHHRPRRRRAVHCDSYARGVVPRGDGGLPRAHPSPEPGGQRDRQPRPRRFAARAGRPLRRRTRRGPLARLDARDAAGDEGHRRCGRLSDDLRGAGVGPRDAGGRQPVRRAHEGRRRDRRRQDGDVRIRPRLAHRQHALRCHRQRVGPVGQRRRIERRRGGVPRAADAAGGRRIGLHGIAAQPRGLEPCLRLQAEPRPRSGMAETRTVRQPTRDRRANGAHRARPGAAAGRSGRARYARAVVAGHGRIVRAAGRALGARPAHRLARRSGRPPRVRARHRGALRGGAGAACRRRCGRRADRARLRPRPRVAGVAGVAPRAGRAGGRRSPGDTRRARAAQARGAVGVRLRAGAGLQHLHRRGARSQRLLHPGCRPVRALRPARAAGGAGLAVCAARDLAAPHRRALDGYLPSLDGDDAVRHLRRAAGDQRARRFRSVRPLADGAAADRPPARRCRIAGRRCRVRSADSRSARPQAGRRRSMTMRWLRRAGWLLLGLAVVWGLWCALAWWALPPVLKTQAQARLSAALGRAVTIGRVRIDPNALALEVDDLVVAAAEPGRPAQLSLPRFFVDFGAASLWRRAVVIDRLELDGLRIEVLRRGTWQLDIDDLFQRWHSPAPHSADEALPRLVLRGARIRDATLVLDDPAARTSHRIDALDFSLPELSTLPGDADRAIGASLALRLDGAAVRITSDGTPWASPRRADWKIAIDGLDLTRLATDIDAEMPLRLRSGRLSAALAVHLTQTPDAEPALDLQGDASVADLALQYPNGAAALGWHALRVQVGSVQPLARRVHLAQLSVDGLTLPIVRDRAGALNFESLRRGGAAPAAAPGTPWQVDVDEVRFDGATVGWRDATTSPAAAFDLAVEQLKLQRLRWPMAAPAAVQASARLRQAGSREVGRIAIDGDAGLDRAALKFTLDAIALPAFQPYAGAWLKPAIGAGSAAAHGQVEWSASGGLRLALTDAQVDQLAIGDAGWRRLALQGLTLDQGARQAKLASLHLIEPRFALARDREGRLNLDRWIRPAGPPQRVPAVHAAPGSPAARAAAKPSPWQWQIEQVQLAGGHVEFDDALAGTGAPLKVRADDLVFGARLLRWPLPHAAPAARLHAA